MTGTAMGAEAPMGLRTAVKYGPFGNWSCMVPGPTHILSSRMTLILGGITRHGDVVVAADGLMIAKDTASGDERVVEPKTIKTARLNKELCVGFAGDVESGNRVFAGLIGREDDCGWISPEYGGLGKWEREGLSTSISFGEARDVIDRHVGRALRWVALRKLDLEDNVPAVILGGLDDGKPRLGCWGANNQWEFHEVPWERCLTIGDYQGNDPAFDKILSGYDTMQCQFLRAIRHRANVTPRRVNGNVSIRTLSSGFSLVWYSPPQQDPPA